MSALAKAVHLLSVSLWIGSVAFFSFVAAPAIFRALPRHQAGDVVGAIFPTYYWIGHALGALALASLVVAVRGADGWSLRTGCVAAVLAVMLAANLFAGFAVQPKVHKIKVEMRQAKAAPNAEPPPKLKAEFDRLHKRSVQLNAVVLIGGLIVLVLSAFALKV